MTGRPMSDIDLDETLACWIIVPHELDGETAGRWADKEATEWCARLGAARSLSVGVGAFLRSLCLDPPDEGFVVRLAYLASPTEFGATVYQLAFLERNDSVSHRDLLQAPFEASLGSQDADFADSEASGATALRFGFAIDASTHGEAVINGYAGVSITRDLSGASLTLVAQSSTVHLESLAMSLPALRHLLVSPGLADLFVPNTPSGTSA